MRISICPAATGYNCATQPNKQMRVKVLEAITIHQNIYPCKNRECIKTRGAGGAAVNIGANVPEQKDNNLERENEPRCSSPPTKFKN
jgi:hypothetical protein